jgi:ribokinase
VITVVGSINLDVVATVDRHPRPGETVLATSFETTHGGKGANQAVAAARLFDHVSFIGAVGRDATGNELVSRLGSEGVDVASVQVVAEPSGTAMVTVDEEGENTIVVAAGANWCVRIDDGGRDLLARSDVVLSQLEVPMDIIAEVGRATRGRFVLNAAPPARIPTEVLDAVDVLIVNQHEAMALSGSLEPDALRAIGVETVVVTLGSEGAQVVTRGDVGFVPALPVMPVDTTGAGDAFCGAFAVGLAEGRDVFASAAFGAIAGALATTRVGARTGMPTRQRLDAAFDRRP